MSTALYRMFPPPVLGINKYIWGQMCLIDPSLSGQYTLDSGKEIMPFFPLADSRGGDSTWGEKPYVVYDQLFKVNGRPLPYIHRAQFVYYIRGQATDNVVWSTAMQHIVDRGDDAAQDCNEFICRENYDQPTSIFYTKLRGFIIDEARDQRIDLQVRQYYTTSLIVEADYRYDKAANNAIPSQPWTWPGVQEDCCD